MSVTFAWSELVSDGLAATIRDAAGIQPPFDAAPIRAAVAEVFDSLGYLPVLPQWPAESERTRIAERLLCSALGRMLAETGGYVEADGAVTQPSSDPRIDAELVPRRIVHLNVADAAALEALPVIGATLAARIVAERRAGGAFASLDDLVSRVPGLGPQAIPALRDVLSCATAVTAEASMAVAAATMVALLQRVLRRVERPTPAAALFAALQMTAVTCRTSSLVPAAAPVPVALEAVAPATHAADLVVPLSGTRYFYSLIELFAEATSSIAVAMFHAALPLPRHPTRQLLDALIAAHGRGVAVRVLLDRDRASDPYYSTVINQPARDYLLAAGVETRHDAEATLLHSKLVVIDRRIVVVGSHNWSAGSYFQFDDLSLAITSTSYGAAMEARFDALWVAAGP